MTTSLFQMTNSSLKLVIFLLYYHNLSCFDLCSLAKVVQIYHFIYIQWVLA